MTKILDERVSLVSTRMMSILLNGIFGEHDCADIRLGLPAGAVHLRDRKLIVAATVCDPPMFQDAIKQAAISTGSDVLISHHGFYPETLNHAYFSVASQIAGQLCQFDQMLLYVHRADGYWLVPDGNGPFIALAEDGLAISQDPPFFTYDQRADGVCEAAKLIARRTRNGGIL